jgi:hypothetical protein
MRTDADQVEHGAGALPSLRGALAAQPQPELDVLERGQMRKQAIRLKDHAHVPVIRRYVRDVLPADQHAAGVGVLETSEDPQCGGLAAARRPEQRHELARRHVEVEAVERPNAAEAAAQAIQPDRDAVG